MKFFCIKIFLFFVCLSNFRVCILFSNLYDVTIVGSVKFTDARGRLPIGFIDTLKNDLNINFIPIKGNGFELDYIDDRVKKIILNPDKAPGKIAILFSSVCLHCASCMPNSFIKLAYSVFEASYIPKYWIQYANKNFDAILVPDQSLVKAYKKSGISIPVFLVPSGLYLQEFLDKPIKTCKNKPFIFGIVAGFWPHKNHELLINAFLNKFGDNPNVILRMQGSSGNLQVLSKIKELINGKKNIELINRSLSQSELIEFMGSLDCYVLVSKGEGFSVTPREAIALGIPTIISNNTAHKTLCKTPYFIPVKSNVKEKSNFDKDLGVDCGYNFKVEQKDLEQALELVYLNYNYYFEKSQAGRQWVQQYLYKNLKAKYLNFIKPQNIVLSSENLVREDCLITNSEKLYRKYLNLYGKNLLFDNKLS